MADPNTIPTKQSDGGATSEPVSDPMVEPVLARLVETQAPIVATLVESPSTESPGTESPGTESPGTESPGTESPGRAVVEQPPFTQSHPTAPVAPPVEGEAGRTEFHDQDQTDPCLAVDHGSTGAVHRSVRFLGWIARGCFCIASLVVLLAVLTAIPLLQLIAFGYLLQVAGGLAQGGKLRDSLPCLPQAGQIGLAALAVFLAALPTQLLAHWESVAYLINPGSGQATAMRVLAITCAMFATGYLLWAWVRGGRLRHYLWPQPKRFVREGWRWSTWRSAPDRLWDFTASLELPRLFWLGLRGAAGTLVWLIPAMIIVAAFRNGETGLAGLVGFISLVFLGIGMLYLPMLQAHFAAENRFSALFEVRTIRRQFRRAPWAWLVAMIFILVITPIPLYLLKVEATPREVMWLPCLVFVAFMLPARVAGGLALRRARRRPDPQGGWARFSRWTVRLLMPIVVGIYLLFVYVSQYTSWDGLATWVQQHAILIPVPFLSGV